MRVMSVWLAIILWIATSYADPLEEWIESSLQPDELQAWLDDLRQIPLDLNTASTGDIARLPFFDSQSAQDIIEARRISDGFRGMDEVYEIPGLTVEQRLSLRSFATVQTAKRSPTKSIRIYAASVDDEYSDPEPAGWGGRIRADLRKANSTYGYVYGRRVADEADALQHVAAGVDIPAQEYVPRIVGGDYQFETGTGLVFASAYGMSNWISSMGDLRPGTPRGLAVRPSANRLALLRGGAVQVEIGKIAMEAVVSVSPLDATRSDSSLTGISEGESSSSAQLWRARRNQVEERLIGGQIHGHWRGLQAGVSSYNSHFSPEFGDVTSQEVLPRFAGSELEVGGVYIQGAIGGLDVIAEAAQSNPGGIAHQSAVSWSDNRTGFSIYHVYADADFYSPHSKQWGGYGEESGNSDATGVRIRAGWSGYSGWITAAINRTPFRTSTSPLSKTSGILETRWLITAFQPVEFELLGSRSSREDASVIEPAETVRLDRGRIDAMFRTRDEYRIRLEVRSAKREFSANHSLGTLLFFQVKSRIASVRAIARLTFFDFDNDDVTTQVYETGLPGGYPLVSLTGTGRRASVVLSRSWGSISIAAKAAHIRRYSANDMKQAVEMGVAFGYAY